MSFFATAETAKSAKGWPFLLSGPESDRIKGSFSASGRDPDKVFASKRRRILLWLPLAARAKNHLLCDLPACRQAGASLQ